MLVVKLLLFVATPIWSALFLYPVMVGPPPAWACVAIAIINPFASMGFYKLIRCVAERAAYCKGSKAGYSKGANDAFTAVEYRLR